MHELTPNDMDSVPFGNSLFQIEHFVIGAGGEARQRRNCLLQLNEKYNTLQECRFRRQRIEIDIAEIEEKLSTASGFPAQRLSVDLEEKNHCMSQEIKLIKDCMVEAAAYQKILSTLPECTREEFEAGEFEHWRDKMLYTANREVLSGGTMSPGTIKSLESVGVLIQRNEGNELTLTVLEPDAPSLAEQLAEQTGRILPEAINDDNILCIDKTDNQ